MIASSLATHVVGAPGLALTGPRRSAGTLGWNACRATSSLLAACGLIESTEPTAFLNLFAPSPCEMGGMGVGAGRTSLRSWMG